MLTIRSAKAMTKQIHNNQSLFSEIEQKICRRNVDNLTHY